MARILVVDDDDGYANSLSKRLRLMGFDSIRVSSGAAALEYCRTSRPDLILLDWAMPGLSGRATLQVLGKVRQTRDIPVIVISGLRLEPEDERAALACGARNFLGKMEICEESFLAKALERHVRALLPEAAGPESTGDAPTVATLERPDFPPSIQPTGSSGQEEGAFSSPVAPTILVIDDEPETAELLNHLFKDAECRIEWASTAKAGLSRAMTEFPDLAVVDLHLPGTDGGEVCRALRERSVASSLYLPILILTGDVRESRQVHCLNVGADDYLIKPPSHDVLSARVNALLRRTRFLLDANDRLVLGRAVLDCRTHRFHAGGESEHVSLTKAEAGIMLLLMSARGGAVDQRLIHRKVCRSSTIPDPRSSTIKSHISHIRAKLGRHAGLIVPVNGEGAYRFDVDACRS